MTVCICDLPVAAEQPALECPVHFKAVPLSVIQEALEFMDWGLYQSARFALEKAVRDA